MVIASTASPYKFANSVLDAISGEAPADDYAQLDQLNALSHLEIPKALAELKEKEIRFSSSITKEEMENTVLQMLHLD